MDQSAPILYFNDVRLYEDDLHDVGDTLASCKVRVMPSCLYVLYRNFVRVDGVMLRARDTRGECEASELTLKERLFPRKGRSQGKRVRVCNS
jgi:type 2A phosphatase activator TIP41